MVRERTLASALDPVADADGLAVGELCPVGGADALVGVVLEVRHDGGGWRFRMGLRCCAERKFRMERGLE